MALPPAPGQLQHILHTGVLPGSGVGNHSLVMSRPGELAQPLL